VTCVVIFLAGCGTSAPPAEQQPVEELAPSDPFPDSGVALTRRAAEEVQAKIKAEPARDKLRISFVEKFGGDRHWQAALVPRVDAFDDETFASHGVTIVVDRGTRKFIEALRVDYREGTGFTFATSAEMEKPD
jgi:Fe-S cluster assembly iron-binding protein IscA